jgi:hypothetical protein
MPDRRWTLRRARDAGPPHAGPERRGARLAVGEAAARQALLGLVLAQALVVAALSFGLWPVALVLHLACCLALPLVARRQEGAPAGWPAWCCGCCCRCCRCSGRWRWPERWRR